jgi:hypothetical protein
MLTQVMKFLKENELQDGNNSQIYIYKVRCFIVIISSL